MTTWIEIPGYEDEYEISSDGEIRSKRNSTSSKKLKVLKHYILPTGYLQTCLSKKGKQTKFYIHRLVLAAFLRPPIKGETVNHINGIKPDNRLENLEYMSREDNVRHGVYVLGFSKSGTNHHNAKLTENDVLQIRLLAETQTHQSISTMYPISRANVTNIVNRRNWKHLDVLLTGGA